MKQNRKAVLKFALLAMIIVAAGISGNFISIDKQTLRNYFGSIPLWYSAPIFLLLYVASDFVNWVLKDILKIIGALVFGAYLSTLLIYLSEIVNAVIFFRLSSVLGRPFVERFVRGGFKSSYEKIGQLSFAWIFILRLVPLVPFRVMDMVFGISEIRLRKYLIAVVIASPLRIFWIQYILAGLQEGFSVAALSAYLVKNPTIVYLAFIYFIAATISVVVLRKKLR